MMILENSRNLVRTGAQYLKRLAPRCALSFKSPSKPGYRVTSQSALGHYHLVPSGVSCLERRNRQIVFSAGCASRGMINGKI